MGLGERVLIKKNVRVFQAEPNRFRSGNRASNSTRRRHSELNIDVLCPQAQNHDAPENLEGKTIRASLRISLKE
jgi:hypothetical protein